MSSSHIWNWWSVLPWIHKSCPRDLQIRILTYPIPFCEMIRKSVHQSLICENLIWVKVIFLEAKLPYDPMIGRSVCLSLFSYGMGSFTSMLLSDHLFYLWPQCIHHSVLSPFLEFWDTMLKSDLWKVEGGGGRVEGGGGRWGAGGVGVEL